MKSQENINYLTQRKRLENVHSSVKHEMSRRILRVVSKHKANYSLVQDENLKLVNKILSAKSSFNFKIMDRNKRDSKRK
jgi:hypothetical protein